VTVHAPADRIVRALEGQPFDLIVIGAGINGSGIARDAALRGLRVLLLDRGDVGGGTTAWSTRLIHGGLRYLEHGEIGLVRESLRERDLLFRNAAHLVRPLPFLLPLYRHGRRGPRRIRLGMTVYDLLSLDGTAAGSRMLDRRETLSHARGLEPDGLLGAAAYVDGQAEFPERLTLENALSAVDHGASLLTYARVDELLEAGHAVIGVRFTDLLDPDRRRYEARAPVTVNVTGPSVDDLAARYTGQPLIGGTRGSHIVVDGFPGAPEQAIYVENRTDGRPYFILPWNSRYLIGTTDDRYAGEPDSVTATDDEIDYLIRDTNRVIPAAGLTRADVLYAYAGVRPLPHAASGAESGITRRHFAHDHAPEINGLISVVGGKLTTHRNLAERVVDLVYRKLGQRRAPSRTRMLPLPGANVSDFAVFADRFSVRSGLDEATAGRLLRVYGTLVRPLLASAGDDPAMREPLPGAPGTIQAEIPFAFRWEGAQTLTDALMRRTVIGLEPDNGRAAVEPAAQVAMETLGWDDTRARQEVESYVRYVERFRP
jgi:glycerol-3-phosphate dehydrogenase